MSNVVNSRSRSSERESPAIVEWNFVFVDWPRKNKSCDFSMGFKLKVKPRSLHRGIRDIIRPADSDDAGGEECNGEFSCLSALSNWEISYKANSRGFLGTALNG